MQADRYHDIGTALQRFEHTNGIIAIETKLASTITDTDLRHLHWLNDTLPNEGTT